MPTKIKIFNVTDGPEEDANVLFTGSANDICEYLGGYSSQVYRKCDKNKSLYGQYYIRSSGTQMLVNLRRNRLANEDENPKPKIKKVKGLTKKQEDYLYITHHLDIYGLTSYSKDPIKAFGNKFEEDGYIIEVTHRPRIVIKAKGFGENEVWDELWLIKLIKKVEVNNND